MKISFHILIVLAGFNFSFGQKLQVFDSIQLNRNGQITDFATDEFNGIYFIQNSMELNKIDFKTKKISTFSNRTVLEDLNTQNVLQITVKSGFFKLLLLDNQLNIVQDAVSLIESPDFSPILTALVDTNYLWGYDPVLQRLVLWNYREKTIFRQSVILNDKTSEEFFSELIYDKGKIYLVGKNKILKFDDYANLKKVIPISSHTQIQILSDWAYYTNEGELFSLNLKTEKLEKLEITKNFDYFSINPSYLFVLKDKLVYIYPLQKTY
ncbi:MAG: hypothetical protein PHC38_09690 [Weeksellaceae bacterium]|nr:hypothetical protein [Weeksellaceae bacterium]